MKVEIYRKPHLSSRVEKEFYDDYDCDDPQAVAALVKALREVDKGQWWYWAETSGTEEQSRLFYDPQTRKSPEASGSEFSTPLERILAG